MVFDGVAYALVEALPATPVVPGWTTAGALDVRLSEGAVSTDGTRIYATHGQWFNTAGSTIGPTSGGRVITSAGVVASLPSASVARRGVAGAWCNGKHYAIAGIDNNNVYQSIVEAYTPAGADGASGVWTVVASSPSGGRAYASAATVGNFIYLVGGASGSGADAGCYRYDTVNNVWATLASLPAARTQGAMVAYQGKLYYLGGLNSSGGGSSAVFVYDIAGGTWSTASYVLTLSPNNGWSRTLMGSKIYSVGGTFLRILDPLTGTETASSALPSEHTFGGLVALGSNLYAVSGQGTANVDRIDVNASGSFGASVQAVQAVTALAGGAAAGVAFALPTTIPTAPGWATVGIVPETYRYDAAVSSDGTRAYVSHGYHQGTATNTELTPSAFTVTADGSFAMMPNSPTSRYGAVGAFCNGKHYAIGGLLSNNATTSLVEAYVPAGSNGASGVWSTVAGNNSLAYSSAAVVGNFIYVAGGQTSSSIGGMQSPLSRYDTTSNTWVNLANMPAARTQGAMVAYQGKLYYLGGYVGSGASTTSIYVYDIAANTWSTSPFASPIDLAGISASIVGSTVYFAGGSGNATVYQINLSTGSTAGAKTTPADHGGYPGMVSIGSAIYLISGSGRGAIDRIDTTSGLTAYQANLALLKALVAA